jgi:hypothetical protein
MTDDDFGSVALGESETVTEGGACRLLAVLTGYDVMNWFFHRLTFY